MTKKELMNKLLQYVSEKYCDDEIVASILNDYYQIEKKLALKRGNRVPVKKITVYRISNDVRKFLEPFVDAEYYKLIFYTRDFAHDACIYKAMKELNTREYQKFLKENCLWK